MILGRLYEEWKKQNWSALCAELVIVIVGVFIGIQVSNWNDERVERRLERGYLIRLYEDIVASADGISTDNQFLERQLSNQQSIISALDECSVKQIDPLEIQRGIITLGYVNPPRFFSRTYQELTSSGRMDIIQGEAIKAELAGIVARVEFLNKVHEGVLRTMEHYRYSVEEQVRYDTSTEISQSGNFAVDFDIRQLCQQPSIISAVSAVSNQTSERLTAFRRLYDRYNEFLPMLEEELFVRWGYRIE